jgi:hypothetical protein
MARMQCGLKKMERKESHRYEYVRKKGRRECDAEARRERKSEGGGAEAGQNGKVGGGWKCV